MNEIESATLWITFNFVTFDYSVFIFILGATAVYVVDIFIQIMKIYIVIKEMWIIVNINI